MDQSASSRYFKNFYLRFNLFTEAYSFFIVVPGILFYVWSNIQLTPEQFRVFNKIWPAAFVFGIAFVLVNNWIVLIPVLRYLKKYVRGQPVSPDEYERAKKRLLHLPVIHAVGAFFRWVILLANAIVPFSIIVTMKTPQLVNMWMGVVICSLLGTISYFSIAEILVQGLLDRGAFPGKTSKDHTQRVSILQRLSILSISAVLLPMLLIVTFFYITVESAGIANPLLYARLAIFAFLSMLIGMLSPILLNKTIRDKVRIVTDFLKQIGSGDLNCLPREVPIHDEIGQIIKDVDDMKGRLRESRGLLLELNLNLEKKVAGRTEELEAANHELGAMNENLVEANRTLEENERTRKKELALAAAIQASFLPRRPPMDPLYDIAFVSRPWSEVSGDFFDFYEEGGSLKGLGMFDVSGHGMSSGLLTLLAKSIITRNFYLHREEKLSRLMEFINEDLILEMGRIDNYLTGVLLRFNADAIEFANCASPEILFRSGASGKIGKIVDKTGKSTQSPFLGIAEMKVPIHALSVKLAPGDGLLLYTDCLIESRDASGRQFQESGVIASLKKAPEGSAREMLNGVLNGFYEFLDKKPPEDDLTVIYIKRK